MSLMMNYKDGVRCGIRDCQDDFFRKGSSWVQDTIKNFDVSNDKGASWTGAWKIGYVEAAMSLGLVEDLL